MNDLEHSSNASPLVTHCSVLTDEMASILIIHGSQVTTQDTHTPPPNPGTRAPSPWEVLFLKRGAAQANSVETTYLWAVCGGKPYSIKITSVRKLQRHVETVQWNNFRGLLCLPINICT